MSVEVLLKKDISDLGQAGDIRNVRTGYARNYLIPKGLVIVANAKSKKEQSFLKQVQERKIIKRKREAEGRSSELKDVSVELKAKLGSSGKLYGSITSIDIHKALINKGLNIDRRMIILEEPIKTLGIFKVKVKLYQGVHTDIQVIVADEQGETSVKDTESSADTTNVTDTEVAQEAISEEMSDTAQKPEEKVPPPLSSEANQANE